MKKILLSTIYFLVCVFSIQAQILYGTTSAGGSEGQGTIIRFIPNNNLTVLKSFKSSDSANGVLPTASLLLASNGKLYGMTHYGGSTNVGVLFSYDLATGNYTKLHDFDGANGASPFGGLIQASNGKLYGMTQAGDISSVIFSFDPSSSTFTNLKVMDHLNGEEPLGSLMQAGNGKLYGTTNIGGSTDGGVIFSFDPLTGTYTKLHDFVYDSDGGNVYGNLLQAKDGKLYGMATGGGVNGFGTIYSFDPSSSIFTKLKDFDFTNGGYPEGSLIQLPDGKLYGTAQGGGGVDSHGVIFSYDPSSNSYTILKRFDNTNGGIPRCTLLQAGKGKLYGMTYGGGSSDAGVIFSFDPSTSTYTKLKDFDNTNGANPDIGSAFVQVANANIPSLTLTPETGTASINTNHCFDALLKDPSNNPLAGVRIDFRITGANPGSTGFVNTNSSGIAHFCYTGLKPGTDTIEAAQGLVDDASTFVWTGDFYSKATGDLHNVLTWGLNPNGSGANPPDFNAGTFHLANRAPTYDMTFGWSVGGKLDIPAGSQLHLNQYTLIITNVTGAGSLYGGLNADLIIAGNAGGEAGPLKFANGGGFLSNLTLNRVGPSAMATILSPLRIRGALSIMNGTLNTGNNITLISDVAGTARVTKVSGTVSGFVTVERYIPARRAWRIMSAPVAGTQTINAAWQEGATTFSSNPNPHPGFGTHITEGSGANGFDHNPFTAMVSIKKYNTASDSWVPLTNTTATNVNSDAYLLFIRGDRGIPLGLNTVPATSTTLRVSGPLKTGDQLFPVSTIGFTAIPNPFACPINFKTITRTNVPDNFYLWDPKLGGSSGVGGYVLLSANGSGGYDITPAPVSPESQFIQSGQGFLVHATGSGASIVIKESDKSNTGSNTVFRSANTTSNEENGSINTTKGLRTSLQIAEEDKTTSVLDETFTSYSIVYSNKIDEMDPVKLPNINENLGIIRDGQSLMIERRQEFTGNDTINLQLWNTSQRSYLLQFNPVNLASSKILSAYLEDRYLHTSTPVSLSEATKVYFAIDANAASANRDRFRVVLSGKGVAPADITSAKSAVRLFSNPINGNYIRLQFINQPEGTYSMTLFNNIGQEVYRGKIMHGGGSAPQTLELTNRIAKGVYQLHVQNEQGKIISGISVVVN